MFLLSLFCLSGVLSASGQGDAGYEVKDNWGKAESALEEEKKDLDESERIMENTEDHITVIDSYGNRVTIAKPINSMLSTGMGQSYAALKALNAQDSVGAVCDYVTRNKRFFPELSKLPAFTVGEQSVNNELILQLNPDFIVTSPFWLSLFNQAVLDEIPIVQLNYNSTEAYRILGSILGKEKEAEEFVEWIKSYTTLIDERISTLCKEDFQKVFIYYGGEYGMASPPPYGTFGEENILRNRLIGRAGGISISEELEGEWITVDPEWVVAQNPPVLIRECYIINDHPELGYDVTNDHYASELMNSIMSGQPAFEGCDAVKNKRVHLLYGDLTEDSWFISLAYMAKWLHPELFEDIDPVEMQQEYITRFQRLDFDVKTQGLFTYSAK